MWVIERLAERLLETEKTFDTNSHPGAFLWAIKTGNIELVKLMIQKGADVNASGDEGYQEPPDWIWHLESQGELLVFSCNPLKPLFDLPVSVAIRNNNIEILELLLKQKVDMNKEGFMGRTPQDVIGYSKNAEVIREIIQSANSLREEESISSSNASSLFFVTSSGQANKSTANVALTNALKSEETFSQQLNDPNLSPEEVLFVLKKLREHLSQFGYKIELESLRSLTPPISGQ